MAGTVTLGGFLNGLPVGQINVGPFSITPNSLNNLQVTYVVLVMGANTISVPSWAIGMIIVPSTSNAIQMTLKGVTGDTGIPLALTNPSLINFPASPPASFVLTAASLFVTPTEIMFF